MTRAESVIFHNDMADGSQTDLERGLSIHAQQFAEWCYRNGWVYDTIDFWEHKIGERKTTSELYTIFNNQNK